MILLGPLIVHYVPKTLITGIKQEHQVAYHARMVRRRKKVAPNVNLVKQECLVMLLVKTVKIAMLANTVQVSMRMVRVLLQLRALVVQLDIAKVREDKLRAFHAFPVHSMILPVRLLANFANRILFQAIKIEPCHVTNVPVVT